MENVGKYFILLEELQLVAPDEKEKGAGEDFAKVLEGNVGILQKHLKMDLNEVRDYLVKFTEYPKQLDLTKIANSKIYYVCGVELVLAKLMENLKFDSDAKEDLISVKHIGLCISALKSISNLALRFFLHRDLCKAGIYAKISGSGRETNYDLLRLNVEFFTKALKIKQFHIANSMETVIRDYQAAIFTLLLSSMTKEILVEDDYLKKLQNHLDYIWTNLNKVEYFRNLMFLKGLPELPKSLQKRLDSELLQRLSSKEGFHALVSALYVSKNNDVNEKQSFDLIAKIVAFRGYSQKFQTVMIKNVWDFVTQCILQEDMSHVMGAGLLTLRKLYDINDLNQMSIRDLVAEELMKLSKPKDLLTGLILMEHQEFCLLVSRFYNLFCTSSVECLPTKILFEYLPLLLQIHYELPKSFPLKKQLEFCIVRCLDNRSEQDIENVVKNFYLGENEENWCYLNPRVIIAPSDSNPKNEIVVKIANPDFIRDSNLSLALPEVLMSSSFNLLTYRIFMKLLNMMLEQVEINNGKPRMSIFQNEEDLIDYLNAKYPIKVELLMALNMLVAHGPLKTQLNENSSEFLDFLKKALEMRINHLKKLQEKEKETQVQTLVILLTLLHEVVDNSPLIERFDDFIPKLQDLRNNTSNQLVRDRVDSLIAVLNGESKASVSPTTKDFATARSLVEANEPHLQVCGIQKFIELLRKEDPHTMANSHIVLALAMTTLRDKDSYTFLNTVRLIVALVNVLEAEVLELLSDKFLNERAVPDERLVVGEALIKVSQELGPLCYKYKDILLNCFMNGCRSSNNEFRMSAFANMAQLCKTLAYQVHQYFHELLNIIDCELTTGKYIPAQRAAVLVLSELLDGIPNLVDFSEMLLPIYHVLKLIDNSESCDQVMRLHAAKGLQTLSEKCKEFFFPKLALEKEIKILNINSEQKPKSKTLIQELN